MKSAAKLHDENSFPQQGQSTKPGGEEKKRRRDGGLGGFPGHGKVFQGRSGEAGKDAVIGKVGCGEAGPGGAVELPDIQVVQQILARACKEGEVDRVSARYGGAR